MVLYILNERSCIIGDSGCLKRSRCDDDEDGDDDDVAHNCTDGVLKKITTVKSSRYLLSICSGSFCFVFG